MGHFGVYLTNNNNTTLELPVAPEEVMVLLERNTETLEILKLGEVNQIGEPKLKEITISSSFLVNPKNQHYSTANGTIKRAEDYLSFFSNWQNSKKVGRITISTTKINLRVTVESFEYGFRGGNADEYVYTLKVKEWRDLTVRQSKRKIAVPRPKPKPRPRPAPPQTIGIGSTVIVNGQLHVDSYGSGPGQIERNATRKVNFMASGRACPYHVTTMDGGWRGWVTAGSVRLA